MLLRHSMISSSSCSSWSNLIDFCADRTGIFSFAMRLNRWARGYCSQSSSLLSAIETRRAAAQLKPLIKTRARLSLLGHIENKCNSLASDQFRGSVGIASSLVYGEKNIGKSTILLDVCNSVSTLFPQIVPVYVDMSTVNGESLRPSALMRREMEKLNIRPTTRYLNECIQALRNNNKYALLIVDELDAVYRSTDSQHLEILEELAMLGSNDSGRVVALICGSVSVLPLLITKELLRYPKRASEFPLLRNAPDLNATKFRSFHLSQRVSRTDYDLIAATFNIPPEMASACFFLAGNNIRGIESLAATIKRPHVTLESIWDMHPDELLNELYSRLIKKNKRWLKELECSSSHWEYIISVNWFETLIPLDPRELEQVLVDLNSKRTPQDYFSPIDINDLIDKGWLSGPASLSEVYPTSGLRLFYVYLNKRATTLK